MVAWKTIAVTLVLAAIAAQAKSDSSLNSENSGSRSLLAARPKLPHRRLPRGTLVLRPAQQRHRDALLRALGISTAYPCEVGNADCFCRWKKRLGFFTDIDPAVKCSAYYWCYARVGKVFYGVYESCQSGLIFDQFRSKTCNWPRSAVHPFGAICPAGSRASSPSPPPPSPPPPVASPSPPLPVASPSPPPPVASPSPPPPVTSPSPSPSSPPPPPSPVTSPMTSPSPPSLPLSGTNNPNVTVAFQIDSDWGSGYQGTIVVENNNPYDILNWELSFDFADNFTWGPDANASPNGTRMTLTPKDWTKTIAKGAQLQLTFGATNSSRAPSNFDFTQLLPLLNPNNDPSLLTRGTFGPKVFAPYVDATAYPTPNLASGPVNATGQLFYTLAFIIASQSTGSVAPAWAGVYPVSSEYFYDQIRALRLKGGDVIVSFGGANGIELSQAITNLTELVAAYQSVVDMYKLSWIDFDVEGGAVADPPSVDRRNQALAALKRANPGLNISYTLPVLPTGLTADGVNLLRSAVANGFVPDVINVMAMDFGDSAAPNPNGQMGTYAIMSANATYAQAQSVGLLNSQIGITPMIGKNDVETEVFNVTDAQQLGVWAKATPWVRSVAFWSVNRDNYDGTTYVSPSSSSIPQNPYDFTRTFKAAFS